MNSEYPKADFLPLECLDIMTCPKINQEMFGNYPPGTVRIGKPKQEADGSWTVLFVYRAEGWLSEEEESQE